MKDTSHLKVVEFPSNQASGENVVERLEEALELAKAGQLSNIMIVAAGNDGSVMDCWANRSKPHVMVGGLVSLQSEFVVSAMERRED